MFFETFISLCDENNVKKTNVAKEIGLNPSAVVKWKNGSMPSAETIEKLAEYFNVSIDYLLTGKEKEQLTKEEQDRIEIDTMTDEYLSGLFNSEEKTFMLNGNPASEEAIDYLRESIRFNIEYAKKINDEKNKK